MSRGNSVLMTLVQIAVGVVIAVAAGLVYFLIFNKFLWQLLINERISHGFWVGLLLLISITCSYGILIVGVTKGIQYVGLKFKRQIPFKPVCSGAFLGAPTIVGLVALLNIPWSDIELPANVLLKIILPLIEKISFLLSLPVRIWSILGIPLVLLYVLAIPIGAIIGYRLTSIEDPEVQVQET